MNGPLKKLVRSSRWQQQIIKLNTSRSAGLHRSYTHEASSKPKWYYKISMFFPFYCVVVYSTLNSTFQKKKKVNVPYSEHNILIFSHITSVTCYNSSKIRRQSLLRGVCVCVWCVFIQWLIRWVGKLTKIAVLINTN